MKRYLLVIFLLSFYFTDAQTSQNKPKKYPSLLWEISGKGLTKPSYLFGTMHVSSKLAFHLSDSFYLGIRNADVVALETNPETWQQDLRRYEHMEEAYKDVYSDSRYVLEPNDFLRKSTLQVSKYESMIERALSSRPVIINNLLYRSNSDESSDFEEDTYLDLHIFQTGKRWGKKICSVENFDECMRLTTEAYVDGMKDDKRKMHHEYNPEFSYDKLETAYRTGNLDLLDTITQVNQQSAAFTEKFLYKRNEIQAASIDSILKTKATLFVGVGASHLPGQRGVIELLRNMGYRLRPVKMGERNSRYKDEVDKVRVTVPVKKQVAADGFFKVDMPGELFSNKTPFGFEQFQYADMANGSYYMITRIPTQAALWGASTTDIAKQVDSLLYENIPGKILTKKSIVCNNYQGFDIVNKTRRGDYQRNAIFITPFEVLIFKVSGTGEYVKVATEANRFFNSIELKEYTSSNWKQFSPSFGGFEVSLPHEPFVYSANEIQYYRTVDKKTGNSFQVQRTAIHNYDFAEEDSFDLNLMEESFSSSEFIDEAITPKHSIQGGYPALDVQYKHKDGNVSMVRYLLKGPHYYTLIAHGKKADDQMRQFLSSFSIKPFAYKQGVLHTDTSLHFTVTSPVPLEKKHEAIPSFDLKQLYKSVYKESDDVFIDNGQYKEKLIMDDSTGERIYVGFYNASAYYYEADSAKWMSTDLSEKREGWIVRKQKVFELPGAIRVNEYIISDTNSSRALWCKQLIKKGIWYWIGTETDTTALQSLFLTQFFQTFQPADTLQSINPFEKKSKVFFEDFFSADSVRHKKAVMNVNALTFHIKDLNQLKKAIGSLGWKEKQYLATKKQFIWQLATLQEKEVTDYLKSLYVAAGDTLELQHAILESLLGQRTSYAYATFRDIILNEPPVLEIEGSDYNSYNPAYYNRFRYNTYSTISTYNDIEGGAFLERLTDSLQLTAGIFKDLLPLVNIDDYEGQLMQLMQVLVDSNYLKAKDYDIYFTKFLMEAKQAWKKQSIGEKSKSIEVAQMQEDGEEVAKVRKRNQGNDQLNLYTTLLMPFWDIHASVPSFIQQLLTSSDQQLKYNVMQLLLRNGKPVPDTLVDYFAAKDDYRYDLYHDLRTTGKLTLLSEKYTSKESLAKAKLITSNEYENVDTLQLLDKVAVEHLGRKGFIYIYKYKEHKDEVTWKIATVGLIPAEGSDFEILYDNQTRYTDTDYDFTGFSATKIEDDQPLAKQLQKVVKQLLYAKRKSAAEFYETENDYEQMLFRNRY